MIRLRLLKKNIQKYYKKVVNKRVYNNVFEAAYWSLLIRKFAGIAVYDVESIPGILIKSRFSVLGFTCFLIWYSLYFYCTIKAYYDEQTILRSLYNTKLKQYGDDFERIISIIYVLYTMWKVPFKITGNRIMVQKINDIDKMIKNLGVIFDYKNIALKAFFTSVFQISVCLIRMLCIWVSLVNLNVAMPMEKIFQVVFSDSLAITVTAYYCFYQTILRDRFKLVNEVLGDIKARNSWEYKVFVRSKTPAYMSKVIELQDRHICGKIKECAKIYSMLFKASEATNVLFGFALLLTLFFDLHYMILYMFYFMEATASGLFHDVQRYLEFLILVFWQIAHALGIIYLNVYFSESTMREAKRTAFIVHEIMNGETSPKVNTEAMQMSMQLLHEKPTFTVCGLFYLNYGLLHQGARSVSTYLVILLQFVMDTR